MDGERALNVNEALATVSRLQKKLDAQVPALLKADQYYGGTQPLQFLAPEVRAQCGNRLTSLAINWPRVIVDSVIRRTTTDGFALGRGAVADEDLRALWEFNDLDEWSKMAYTDSAVHARSYLSVGPNDDDPSMPRIMAETAHQIAAEYSPGTRRLRRVLKMWTDGALRYATLYEPVETWRFQANAPDDFGGNVATEWKLRTDPELQPLGVVPFAPLVNRPRVLNLDGESELTDVMPLADAINKLASDLLVSAEYHAMPRRWATGIQIPTGPNRERLQAEVAQYWDQATKDKTWLAGTGVNFGQFAEASLENFIGGIKLLTSQVAAIGGLPPDDLGLNSTNPASAEARRAAETTLIGRVQEKQAHLGGGQERAMQMAVALRLEVPFKDLPEEFRRMETIWRDPATPNVAQAMDAAVKGVQEGIYDIVQGQEAVGLSPVQRDAINERARLNAATAATQDVEARMSLARKLQADDGLSLNASLAAVGLLQAAAQNTPPAT
jgi:hypothetical protein